ncbi:DUF2796 domain-containing protein [Jannaschia donghaensis]|uniref:DUF2796 domain-containing protein n=1 Tax=Jannaschia donghaensis TaxID=420998 RepID=A0A0M6YKA3_9RHOB|nr:DUF2796 domain-containing protein [Jannaschia donghaensis]CTQ49476.1 hypothetical protein JDO7802_01490 [Jannaschia donghaensis]
MKPTIPLLLAIAAGPAFAQETRQMDAHEHGVGSLNIAVDGSTLAMEFHAPGADIVGFEYVAETDADRASVEEAVVTLGQPLDLFVVPTAAGCTVTQAAAELEVEGAHDDEEMHGEDDHGHAEEGHSDEDDDAAASHTEFHAEYQLDCTDPSALTEMTFPYFETFENARELEVQIVTGSGAQAFEVMRDTPSLDLSGLF